MQIGLYRLQQETQKNNDFIVFLLYERMTQEREIKLVYIERQNSLMLGKFLSTIRIIPCRWKEAGKKKNHSRERDGFIPL
jgi:hypothetical protein